MHMNQYQITNFIMSHTLRLPMLMLQQYHLFYLQLPRDLHMNLCPGSIFLEHPKQHANTPLAYFDPCNRRPELLEKKE